ncbi:MAG: hypothetical protein AAF702_31825 [Chloroflexota bacterium]
MTIEHQESVTTSEHVVETDEENDNFQLIIAIFIAIVTLTGAVMAWRAANIEPGPKEQAGLRAVLNLETTRLINNSALYKNLRAYGAYFLNDELQYQLTEALAFALPEEEPLLRQKRAQSTDLAAVGRRFFPQRYLRSDGSYDSQRQLSEAYAQANQSLDLDSQFYFDQANADDSRVYSIMLLIFLLTVSLFCLTIAEGLHPERKMLRLTIALIGSLLFLGPTINFILTELL